MFFVVSVVKFNLSAVVLRSHDWKMSVQRDLPEFMLVETSVNKTQIQQQFLLVAGRSVSRQAIRNGFYACRPMLCIPLIARYVEESGLIKIEIGCKVIGVECCSRMSPDSV
ncbi:hypothetical protein TNCV_2337591 [Trichonephila clavipes]|nr:hypothetical protein TNCV_2337591 [Trichonephila clavipes]